MEYSINQLNEILKDFNATQRKQCVEDVTERNESYEDIRKQTYVTDIDGLFIQFQSMIDSYGENRELGVQFVKPQATTITNYKPI